MGEFLQYEYTFPVKKVKDGHMPKYSVQQQPGETINWRTGDQESVYRTNKKHPELEKLRDVKFRELSQKITRQQLNAIDKDRLADFAKVSFGVDTKKHKTKGALITQILKKQK